ncbi:MAG: ParA family protein [Chloroflexota bacterium]|nr:ParA family protein [Chloroflexota bacterium]
MSETEGLFTIGIAGRKGGSGKSTTANNLAAALTLEGLRCLLIDLDSQASLTRALSDEPVDGLDGIGTRMADPSRGLTDAVRPIAPGLFLAPGDRSIEATANALAHDPGGPLRLLQLLDGARDAFDIAIIDTAPAIGYTQNVALLCADTVVVPTRVADQMDMDALADTLGLRDNLARMARFGLREPATVGTILPTAYDADQAPHRAGLIALRDAYGDLVAEPVPYSPLIPRASNQRRPVVLSRPGTPVATAFRELAGRVLALRARQLRVAAV